MDSGVSAKTKDFRREKENYMFLYCFDIGQLDKLKDRNGSEREA